MNFTRPIQHFVRFLRFLQNFFSKSPLIYRAIIEQSDKERLMDDYQLLIDIHKRATRQGIGGAWVVMQNPGK
jgi:hypothetical protein